MYILSNLPKVPIVCIFSRIAVSPDYISETNSVTLNLIRIFIARLDPVCVR